MARSVARLLVLLFFLLGANAIMNVSQIIISNGYPCEEHVVETSDGFLLSMQRIPYGRNGPDPKGGKRPVVLLQHGLLDSAAAWVINPPNEGLGYILADAGFDVFLGNIRGNTWSSENTKYDPSEPDYWNLIDFDNMIQIDLAAEINKALSVSGQDKLVYVGHSQGTLMGFGGFSLQPEIAAKVTLFIALAPVAFVGHQTSVLLTILADLDVVLWFEAFGVEDFLPSSEIIDEIAGTLCVIAPYACADFIFLLCGWDVSNLNDTRIPLYMDYTPAGTSVRNMAHWAQMAKSGKFEMYDYGVPGNLKHYNSRVPPSYFVQNMTAPPVALFTGSKDDLADPKDVQTLINLLPSSNQPVLINTQPTYQHLDFTWGENAYQLIYPQVVALAKLYSNM